MIIRLTGLVFALAFVAPVAATRGKTAVVDKRWLIIPAPAHAHAHAHAPAPAPDPDPEGERRSEGIVSKMSVEQKVGQTIEGDIASVTPADVATYHVGSVPNGDRSSPCGDKIGPASSWVAAADAYYAASAQPEGSLPHMPVMWGRDAVHGDNNLGGARLFPHNFGIGGANDPDLIHRTGEATATELRVKGLDGTFAPTLAVSGWRTLNVPLGCLAGGDMSHVTAPFVLSTSASMKLTVSTISLKMIRGKVACP